MDTKPPDFGKNYQQQNGNQDVHHVCLLSALIRFARLCLKSGWMEMSTGITHQ
jgi:hypothetical protein